MTHTICHKCKGVLGIDCCGDRTCPDKTQKEKIREKFTEIFDTRYWDITDPEDVADWWLEQFDLAIKETSNTMEELSIQLPKEYVDAVSRRHYRRELPKERLTPLIERMELFYSQYKKAKKRQEKLDKFWEEKNVERHYKRPIWYNAHTRLKAVERDIKANASSMFYTLLEADGNNNGERYDSFWCISPEEIYADFSRKYLQSKKQ